MGEQGVSRTAQREEKTLAFWQDNNIFQKSLEKYSPKGEFVFYDGPPFATGLPHYGSLLSSIAKDVIPRYKTMQGYHVRRRWGWDCHGLPIENMIEKELGLKSKKEVEEIGIDTFNEACRASVLRYADEWKQYIDRIGRWVEYDNAYKTMDNTYMESVWWALKKLYDRKLLYEGKKVLLYCPHCETPLARAEVQMDNSYKDVTEEAVTVKLKVKKPGKHGLPENTYLLAWTTTPWTLPGNVALAVGERIPYVLVKNGDEHYITAQNRAGEDADVQKKINGAQLLGINYEPLYEVDAVVKTGKRAWYVTDGDFVTTDEGTGIVHTAVMYGEDDYALGTRKELPMVPLLDSSGHFNTDAPKFIQGTYFKDAEKVISDDLEKRGLLFDRSDHTHSYPHCHRCDTPLLYNAIHSWFINITKVKDRLIRLNEKVTWFPDHLKRGRFLNILKEAPDWTISRNRYWASPLPIWKCRECSKMSVVGSLKDLQKKMKASGNTYFVMRHGKALSNRENVVNYKASVKDPLTEKGIERVRHACTRMRKGDIDLIVASPLQRTKETADIVAKHLKLKKDQYIVDKRLQELQVGKFQDHSWSDYHKALSPEEQFTKPLAGGETRRDVKSRAGDVLYELEKKYSGKNILLVTHEGVYEALRAVSEGAGLTRSIELAQGDSIGFAEVKHLPFQALPHNKYYELDLHRPYIDQVKLTCACGGDMERISEVVDGWVESGSMPFAEYHYPFENKWTFRKRAPGDFVSEYIAQTRTWFYYMHAVAGLLFKKPSFKNVLSTGNILAEDGSKMSKSKGNYTDPFENLNRYGADALRYYLMGSTVMQSEDVRFMDEELREAHNRVVNILANVLSFYELYAGNNKTIPYAYMGEHVLDRWIRTRLCACVHDVTSYLDNYDTVRAAREIRAFIEDLSTWYVRRSRDRFKSDDPRERASVIATTRFVLLETAKMIAPLMPFLAEQIYQGLRDETMPESVHLEKWPAAKKCSKEDLRLLEDMHVVRDVVSRGLEARARAGVKVRQPLSLLTVSSAVADEYLFLIKDEVNVKEVRVDTEMVERIQLDTEITDELRAEGAVRDFIRHVQDLRKKEGLDPSEQATLRVETDEAGKTFVTQHQNEIKKVTSLEDIVFGSVGGEAVVIDEQRFTIGIKES